MATTTERPGVTKAPPRVQQEGVVTPQRKGQQRRNWTIPIVAFVVIVGIIGMIVATVIVVGRGGNNVSTASTSPVAAAPITVPVAPVASVPVAPVAPAVQPSVASEKPAATPPQEQPSVQPAGAVKSFASIADLIRYATMGSDPTRKLDPAKAGEEVSVQGYVSSDGVDAFRLRYLSISPTKQEAYLGSTRNGEVLCRHTIPGDENLPSKSIFLTAGELAIMRGKISSFFYQGGVITGGVQRGGAGAISLNSCTLTPVKK